MITVSKKVYPALAFVVLAAGASSCQLDDMAAATMDMQQKTGKMAATTSSVSQTSEYTYGDLRQGNSAASREESRQEMEKATRLEGKLLEAALYFKGFEFQLWKDAEWDTEAKRDMLFSDAVEQFLLDVKRYLPHDMNPDPTSSDSSMQNLDAIAATMHELNTNQVLRARELGFKPVSMLDLIKDGLNARKDVDSGKIRLEDLAAYQRKVLDDAPVAVFLLQLRENFLATMVLSQISNIGNTGIRGFVQKADMLLFNWDAQFGKLDLAPLARANDWMSEADRTRDYLLWLGADPKINSKILRIYRKMQVNPQDLPSADKGAPESAKLELAAIQALLDSINAFRS